MTQRADATAWWRELPWLAAAAMTPAVLLVQHVDPCDSTAAVSMGNSMVHIGLCLTLGMLTCLGVALQQGAYRANRSTDRQRRMNRILAIICCVAVAWLALATIAVAGRGNMRYAVNGFWQWTSMIVWSASVCLMATRPGFGRLAITAALALGVAVLVYGFWEYGVIQPELRRQLERDPIGLFRREGISLESSAGLQLADRIRSTEMKGFYALANSLGGFLACYWILALSVWSSRRSRAWIVSHSILVIAVGLGLLLTKSRTAWLAAGGGTVLLVLLSIMQHGRIRSRSLGLGVCIAGAILGVGLLVVYLFDPLILQEAGKSLAYRFDYWRGAAQLILAEPWMGYGVGNFQSTYVQVKLPTAAESPADPHNFLLETAHAGGIPCLLAVGAAIGLALWLAWFQPKDSSQDDSSGAVKKSGSRFLPIAFWSGAALGAAYLITWSIVTDSDERLYGILISLAAFAGGAIAWSRWPDAATSAHQLVNNRAALGVAFAVILVHGLASGGWMLPGAMGLGMFVVGLSVRTLMSSVSDVSQRDSASPRLRWAELGLVGAGASLLAGWYTTMALPISRGTEVVGQVLSGPLSRPSPEQMRKLLTVDRWDSELPRAGMEWTAQELSQPIGKETRGEWATLLQEFQQELLRRDPRSALAWDASGQASARVAATSADREEKAKWLRRADEQFQRASELSPASAQGHIQAALASFWAGDWARCQVHCEESEKIDAATQHRDRKIEAGQVLWPPSLVPREAVLGADARQGMPQDFVRAEPVLLYLRSHRRP